MIFLSSIRDYFLTRETSIFAPKTIYNCLSVSDPRTEIVLPLPSKTPKIFGGPLNVQARKIKHNFCPSHPSFSNEATSLPWSGPQSHNHPQRCQSLLPKRLFLRRSPSSLAICCLEPVCLYLYRMRLILIMDQGLNMFEVTTLGQPLEVTKTTMAANRGDSFAGALGRIWGRGGVLGCKFPIFRYQPPKSY